MYQKQRLGPSTQPARFRRPTSTRCGPMRAQQAAMRGDPIPGFRMPALNFVQAVKDGKVNSTPSASTIPAWRMVTWSRCAWAAPMWVRFR